MLLAKDPKRPRIVARLPFGSGETVRGAPIEALAVAAMPAGGDGAGPQPRWSSRRPRRCRAAPSWPTAGQAELRGRCDPELAAAERGGGLAPSARCRGLRAAGRQAARPIRPAHRQGAAARSGSSAAMPCRLTAGRAGPRPARDKRHGPASCARASPRSPPMSAARPSLPGVAQPAKLSSNENPLGAEPEGDRRLPRGGARAPSLSRWRGGAAARRHRPALRPGEAEHRLRQRLGRADRAADPRLCRAGRRGAVQPPWLPHVPALRRSARGRHAPGRARRRICQSDVEALLAMVSPATRIVFSAIPTIRPAAI